MILDSQLMSLLRPYAVHDLVRLGSKNDGGYVVPNSLINELNFLLSYGYGHNYSFERDFITLNRQNRVILFESSINLHSLLSDLSVRIFGFLLFKKRQYPIYRLKVLIKFLSLMFNKKIKYINKRIVRIPTNSKEMSFKDSTSLFLDSSAQYALKMDIEGAEYECFSNNIQLLKNAKLLIVEFHNIIKKKTLFEEVINKLKAEFIIANLHINNFCDVKNGIPDVIELLFVRKGEIIQGSLVSAIPSLLDSPCNPKKPELGYSY